MGPRRWGRGRLLERLTAAAGEYKLQWGHDAGVVEDTAMPSVRICGDDASMGPRRWGRGRRPAGWRPTWAAGFNGATTLGSWKTPTIAGPTPTSAQIASMGPRRWGRGRPSQRASAGAYAASLQWGHDAGVVEDHVGHGAKALAYKLQWGHDAGVVEDAAEDGESGESPSAASMGPRRWGRGRLGRGGTVSGAMTASMGPRRWGRGRRDGTSNLLVRDDTLQWGHDAGVVEDGSGGTATGG